MTTARTTERLRLMLAILLVVPAGLAVKFCVPGGFGRWCDLYGAAILYEVLWVLMLRLIAPRLAPHTCGLVVLVGTSAVEFLQLWHPPWLDAVRRTFMGAALLGQSFDPWDFAYYVIGSALGVVLALMLQPKGDCGKC
jgi:hypothetical protein